MSARGAGWGRGVRSELRIRSADCNSSPNRTRIACSRASTSPDAAPGGCCRAARSGVCDGVCGRGDVGSCSCRVARHCCMVASALTCSASASTGVKLSPYAISPPPALSCARSARAAARASCAASSIWLWSTAACRREASSSETGEALRGAEPPPPHRTPAACASVKADGNVAASWRVLMSTYSWSMPSSDASCTGSDAEAACNDGCVAYAPDAWAP